MSNYQQILEAEFGQAQVVLNTFIANPQNFENIENAAKIMVQSIKNGGKIISCGNGGSHCDAMHFAEELSGRYRDDRPSMPAIAISDVSHLTCVGNDYGFDHIFSRYVEGLGFAGDVLLGISTSGNSKNIIEALNAAKAKGMKTVLLLGKTGGKLAGQADVEIIVAHDGYADRIQEIHIKVIHSLILLIEKMMVQ